MYKNSVSNSNSLTHCTWLSRRVFIIAEAGVNHNGRLELACELVTIAADAGADAVKFQTFKADKLVARHAPKAAYQTQTTKIEESQLEMVRRLELSEDDHHRLALHCREKGIEFLSSPFDLDSLDFLNRLGLKTIKVPSGEITNLPYLRKLGAMDKEIILSTGMSDLGEVEDALDILIAAGTIRERITALHCNTEYPTPFEDVNLRAMTTIRDALGVRVGYSDHTPGIEVSVAAAALGASMIEKHFTLDRTMPGPDHQASLEPGELRGMIEAIRHIEKALGTGLKRPSPSEIKNRAIARKSIVAARAIRKGEPLTEENLTVKRPGDGISPMRWDETIGRPAERDYEPDDLI